MIKQQVLEILRLKEDHTNKEISLLLALSLSTVRYWIKKSQQQNLTVPPNKKAGRKPLDLTT